METSYQQHFQSVYKYFFFRVRDNDLAMDLTQTTFLKVFSQDKKLDPHTELRYFYTVARNTLIDHRRKKSHISLDTQGDFLEKVPVPHHEQVEERYHCRESLEQLHHLLEQLPDRDREYLTMHYLEELSYDEIAKRTNTFTFTVRQIVSRARKKLQKINELSQLTSS